MSISQSISDSIHTFHHLDPDSREPQKVLTIESQNKMNKSLEEESPKAPKSTILSSAFTLSNLMLGTTIFTFAVRAKTFGLVWLLFFCFFVGAVTYWSMYCCCVASSRVKEDDFSEITEKILGKKARNILNILIIIFTYAFIMCFIALIYSLFGRFIHSVKYRNKYNDFEDFQESVWGKPFVKFPFYIGIAFLLSLICLNKDIKKLQYTSFIGVTAVTYSLLVVTIQCHSYYNHFKQNTYREDDINTHPNWVDLGKAFTKKMDFFKGMACLYGAYAGHTGVFPIFWIEYYFTFFSYYLFIFNRAYKSRRFNTL